MRNDRRISVIIPALNEEPSIGKVIDAIPQWVDEILLIDNGSRDRTSDVARTHGARVIREPNPGYGTACLTGIANLSYPDIVVFLDADFSDEPEKMDALVDPIIEDRCDMVIGSRMLGEREPGALTPQQHFGNSLACFLIRLIWKQRFTDLGPFRAIRYSTLLELEMADPNYGWTVEMQIKAAQRGVRSLEVPVNYRRRIGRSKISGTIRGVLAAGTKILYTIFKAALTRPAAYAPESSKSAPPSERLIVFSRYPEPGKTKTRLIPALGAEGAANVQREMTEHTVETVRKLASRRDLDLEIRYEGGDEKRMRNWLNVHWLMRPQQGDDLGARMLNAFEGAFDGGHSRVVIIGSDCPAITADVLERAFEQLVQDDLVLGPASDGGYYLIGLQRSIAEIFQSVPWGTKHVLRETLRIAERENISVGLLEELDDVDLPEDLPFWERCKAEKQRAAERISVIIPALNETENIARAVKSATAAPNVEVIVVDGGSGDDTAKIARDCGARVIESTPFRARQMNAGANAAEGSILLFLHGDTTLPEGYERCVRETVKRDGVAAGAFLLGIDSPHRKLRMVEAMINWRSKNLQLPYGDQAVFLKVERFRDLHGFTEMPIMEDYEFIRRARRLGRIAICPARTMTSPRRWLTLGVIRTTLINQLVVISYHLGVSPERIAGFYRRNTNREFPLAKRENGE